MQQGAVLFESGQLQEAADIFRRLCEQADLPSSHRAVNAVNLATVYDKMGHVDHAVAMHDYCVGLSVDPYVWAQNARAQYLLKIGRVEDAIGVWQHLTDLEFLPADRAEAVRNGLDLALAKRK